MGKRGPQTPEQLAVAKANLAKGRAVRGQKVIDKEWAFFYEWRRCHNKAKAALRAGYCADNPSQASATGNEVFHRPRVQEWVRAYQEEMRLKYEVTEERLTAELAKLAYSGMHDFTVETENGELRTELSGLSADELSAIQELTVEEYLESNPEDPENPRKVKKVKVKLYDRSKANEILLKHKFQRSAGSIPQDANGNPVSGPQINIVFRDPVKKE